MITFFRLYSSLQVLSILVVLLLLKIPFHFGDLPVLIPELEWMLTGKAMSQDKMIYKDVWTSTSPVMGVLYYFLNRFLNNSALYVQGFALSLVFIQALLINMICNNRKLLMEKGYVAALIYVVIMSASFDLQKLSPALVGTTFILLALNSVLKQSESSQNTTNYTFEIGFFISLGVLTHFPIIALIIWAMIVLILFSNLDVRQFLLMILGFMLPIIFAIIYFSFVSSLEEFQQQWLGSVLVIKEFTFSNFYNSIFVYAFAFALAGVGVVRIFSISRYNSYQNKGHQIVLFLGITTLVSLLLSDNSATYQFAVLAPFLAFFITGFLLHMKSTYLPEIIFLSFLISVLIVQESGVGSFLGLKYDHLNSIRIDQNLSEKYRGKKILVTGPNNSAYFKANATTKYLNWSLSSSELKNPDSYQSVVSINDTFNKEAPSIILDNEGVFKRVFEILPNLGKRYKATQPNVYELKN